MQTWGRYTVFSCIERTYLAEVHDAYLPIAADLVRRVHIRKPSSVRGGASALVQHARQAVQLAHGRIAPILELSYAGDVPLVVSEGVSGRSLATLIEQSRAQQLNLDTNAILYIVIATLEALAHMHQHTDPSGRLLGLVHRDLRPQAVWIGFDGAVHLGGFGFSVTGTAPREPMPPLVEPMYWAPELAAGRAVDHRSDIFSVGAILFELLAKQSVWPGETHEEQLFAASRGQMNVLGPMASSMPAELVRAVEASLSPNPDDRPPSATIFRDELARILYRAEPAYGSARLASTVAMVLGEEAAEDQARATAALHHLAHLEPGLVIRTPDDTSSASPPVSTEPLVESSPSTRERSPAEDSPPVVDVAHLAADLSPTPAASASDLANDFSWLETDHLVSLRHEGSDSFETFDRRHHTRSRQKKISLGESPYPTHSPTTRPLTTSVSPEIEEPDPSAAMADAFSTELSSASMRPPQTSVSTPKSPVRRVAMVLLLVVLAAAGAWLATSASARRQTLKFARLIFIGRKAGGTLIVESIPPGAKVLLDDEDTGRRTPMTMNHLESEVMHHLTLRLTEKIETATTVRITANRRRTLRIVFSEAVSSARVETKPEEASVFINGQTADFTPTTLILNADQEATVKVTKPGYVDHAWTFKPIAGQAIKLTHIFEKTDERKEAEAEEEEAMREAGLDAGTQKPRRNRRQR